MAKYLVKASYTQAGLQGLIRDGGSKRRSVVERMIEALGGRVESFYYAFGETDLYFVAEMPDHASIAALSLAVTAAGGATAHVTVLLTPEELDAAAKKTVAYTAPGQ
jgi:uncharacterized protein with GYD domain